MVYVRARRVHALRAFVCRLTGSKGHWWSTSDGSVRAMGHVRQPRLSSNVYAQLRPWAEKIFDRYLPWSALQQISCHTPASLQAGVARFDVLQSGKYVFFLV